MFYVIVLAWLVGCGLVCLFKHVRHSSLVVACPCLAFGGLIVAALLFGLDQKLLAGVALAIGLYFTFTMLVALSMQRQTTEAMHFVPATGTKPPDKPA